MPSSKSALKAAATLILALAVSHPAPACPSGQQDPWEIRRHLIQEVRHNLLLLPSYSVFDSLEFEVQGASTVVLTGQVTRPSVKNDAESTIQSLDGVSKVIDKIEILPFSPGDDRIRLAVYRAVYSDPGLARYATRAMPPIHIIVKNGHVTLVGVVADEGDRALAGAAANGVSGILSVTNHLKVGRD